MREREADGARERMIATVVAAAAECGYRTGRPWLSPRVLDALRRVPREAFLPPELAGFAYADEALPIGQAQTISQPFIVALMTDLADLGPGDRVLEVGTGSGYQAALLSLLAGEVHSVERIRILASAAAGRLQALGYPVQVHVGDGRAGYPPAAPYDAILVAAVSPDLPEALLRQLRPGGRLVIPVGRGFKDQVLERIVRHADGRLERRACLPVRFVPLVDRGPTG